MSLRGISQAYSLNRNRITIKNQLKSSLLFETNMTPSTPGQMIFAQHLENELRTMGLKDISLDENGYLMATLPGNIDKEVPTVGFIAHLDTSPDMSGRHVTPRIVQSYDGGDITLNPYSVQS